MKEGKQQIVLDYLLTSIEGEIVKQNGRELKKLKIGDKTYNFYRKKPITQRLKNKFNKVIQTIEYKKYELKEKKGLRWVNLDKDKTLTEIQKLSKQQKQTNNLPSRTTQLLMPSATSGPEASRYYSILNIKTSK
jgi:hypothetical protein